LALADEDNYSNLSYNIGQQVDIEEEKSGCKARRFKDKTANLPLFKHDSPSAAEVHLSES